jgi:dihydroorotate dehydrogenase (NAD+) catalytic subunit
MAGRLLGFIPNVETMQPHLGTTLGVGGYWNLPLTCHWLAVSRQQLGAGKPLIATNGARSGLDIVHMLLAGGSAVEMASAVMLRGTSVLESALVEFDNYLREKNVTATEIIGMAADRRKTFPEMPLRANNWKKYVADVK